MASFPKRPIDGLLQPLRAAKDSVKVAKAAGTKEELQRAIGDYDRIYNQRASLKADLVFLAAVRQEILERDKPKPESKFG